MYPYRYTQENFKNVQPQARNSCDLYTFIDRQFCVEEKGRIVFEMIASFLK